MGAFADAEGLRLDGAEHNQDGGIEPRQADRVLFLGGIVPPGRAISKGFEGVQCNLSRQRTNNEEA